MSIQRILLGFVSGVFATLVMDVWGASAGKVGLVSKPTAALLGRWVSLFREGELAHDDIRKSPPQPHEKGIGLAVHYSIGAVLGVVFAVLAHVSALSTSDVAVAVIYGLSTSVFAWFLMFPAFGFGVFGRNAPVESRLLRSSTLNHMVFGLGLAVFFNILRR